MSGDNTTRLIRHLLEKHRIQSDNQIKTNENSKTVQTVLITKSVLQ